MGPVYRVAARVLHRLPYPRGRLAASLAGRRLAPARWRAWAAGARGGTPLVWAHAASVGEMLALIPVVGRLRTRGRGLRVVLTHTSPSVAAYPAPREYDQVDYLPLDEPGPVGAVLDALRPALLLFSRGDLWPELVTQAAARNVTVAVAGATVRPRSARLRWPAVWALRRVQRRVAWLGAVSADDADRWRRLGVPPDRIEVTGDPRHDQITERIPDLRPATAWRAAPMAQSLTVVAGSVEPPEDALLAAAAELVGARWRWLVVPHDPDARRLARVQGTFEERGLTVTRWDGSGAPGAAAVTLMTRRGLLADLYWAGDVAYVGGAWRQAALHAVCEPAVAGIPVAAGPYLASVRDGALLEARGGAVAVSSADVLAARLDAWASPERRCADGLAAREVLETGAAERTAIRLTRLVRLAA